MEGVKVYTKYISNVLKDIEGYVPNPNINPSNMSIDDVFRVVMDIDDLSLVSDILESNGNKGLFKSYSFLNDKINITLKDNLISNISDESLVEDVISKCGNLLANDFDILFENSYDILSSIDSSLATNDTEGLISDKALTDMYTVDDVSDDDYEDEEGYDEVDPYDTFLDEDDEDEDDFEDELDNSYDEDDLYNDDLYDEDDEYEEDDLYDNDYGDGEGCNLSGYHSPNKESNSECKYKDNVNEKPIISSNFNTRNTPIGIQNGDLNEIKGFDADNLRYDDEIYNNQSISNESLELEKNSTETNISYSGKRTINDNLAEAINLLGGSIEKAPSKLLSFGTGLYSNIKVEDCE